MSFVVITRVPDPTTQGNMAVPLGQVYMITGLDYDDPLVPVPVQAQLSFRTPVFNLGEILICGDDGRELVGAMRNPTKWDVDTEHFDDVEEAIGRSHVITGWADE